MNALNKKEQAPPEIESAKKVLLLKGHHTNQVNNDVLRDLSLLTKPLSKSLNRNNEILPFEDCNSIEFLAPKNDCGIFAIASHTKKRPNNLTLVQSYIN